MKTLVVACATMMQQDFSKINEMHIQSNVVFANQAQTYNYKEMFFSGCFAQMVTTATIGVGVNRNIAMSLCKDDIVLFSDDDIVYKDGYNDAIVNAFNEIPKADIIILGIDYEKDGVIYKRKGHKKIKRLHVWNSLKYGAAVFAVKRDALVKNRLCFSTIFGGGCIYSNGEDSLFLIDCIKKGLKVYAYPYILGVTRKNESSWFEGYNEKFFYDKGAWIACAFPMIKNIIKWYFVYRLKPLSNISTKRCLRLMNNGIKGFRTLKGYKEEVVSSENINN